LSVASLNNEKIDIIRTVIKKFRRLL